jgi:hypothetical protein
MNNFTIRRELLVGLFLIALVVGSESILAQDATSDSNGDAATSEKQGSEPASPTKSEALAKPGAQAKSDAPAKPDAPAKSEIADTAASTGDSLQQALKQMQAQLDAQNKEIEKLKAQYASEVDSRQKEIVKQDKQISAQTRQIATQKEAIQSLQQQVDQSLTAAGKSVSDSEKALRSRLETVEDSIKGSQEAESTQYDLKSFPGSLPIPGSSAAIKFGGFVKMNIVESFDPIGTPDRFIVGSIPVPQESGATNTALTVSPSRLNIDLRDTTKYGAVRAFLEADFAGAGDTFRLRHAFGQYKSFLIGKTWTTFMDTRSRPEDLDFEGINGQILLRQPQIRYFPKIGQNWHLLLAAEDPDPNVSGGTGIGLFPDIVASVERTWFDRWHVKSSLLLRKMEGKCDCLDGKKDSTKGWALSISGMTGITRWDERDNLQIQLSYGEGFSHYVNDLGSIGAPDAIFDHNTGQLVAVPVFAMYIAFQKWWSPNIRSNFNYGYVDVDNQGVGDPAAAYKNTNRFIGNIIWSPIARIDLGAQLLFGSRTNEDGEKATAKQLQLSAKYRY